MKQSTALSRPEAAYAPLLWCDMALLVPHATLFGELSPFGIGLAACGGGVPTLICLALGYLLARPFSPVRYLLTVGMVGACRWVVAALPDGDRRRWLPPLTAFVCCGGTGMWMLSQSGTDPYRVLLIVAESCVAAASTLFLGPAMAALTCRRGAVAHRTTLILTGAVAVMAAATVEVGGFSPGRMAAAFLVLTLAHGGQEIGGSVAGCILGGALALSAPGMATPGMALALGGLTAGLFTGLGRWCQSALFLLTVGVVALGDTNERILYYLAEIALASLLFCLLPRRWERWLCRRLMPADNTAATLAAQAMAQRLREAARALNDVADAVKAVARRLRHGEERRTAMEQPYFGTSQLLTDLAEQLERPVDDDEDNTPRFSVEQGIAQLCCQGQRLCGDCAQVSATKNGVLAVLSDGMGSGGRAAVDSAMATGMTVRLWTAGFSPAAVIGAVNSTLRINGGEERLATLDVVTVNTHTGRLDNYKAGAATTLLRSGGRISRLDRPGLPVGILAEVAYEHSHDQLADGDVLLMVSDGALSCGVAAIEELLRDYPAHGSMPDLARAVCAIARDAEDGPSDDVTAVALRVMRRRGIFHTSTI